MIRTFFISLLVLLSLSTAYANDTSWPRTFNNADGTVTKIATKPKRVLSTTVTVTGTLLAMDAPVTASATAGDSRFFDQWEQVAKQRNITELWPAGAVDTEMAYSVMPDLIIVSLTGADSVIEQVAELQLLAPVIVVDYGGQTWQQLAVELSTALGMEESVNKMIADYDNYVASIKLNAPDKLANVIRYNGAGIVNSIAKSHGPHSELVRSLGFEIEAPDDNWEIYDTKRNDFVRAHYETLTQLKAPITFMVAADQAEVDRLLSDPVLANLPSVKNKQVYQLGANSFRIDYYSSMEVIELMKQHFANN